jgi:acyl-CoA dehydrogenase
MDFSMSPKGKEYHERVSAFMDEYIYPSERVYFDQMAASDDPNHHPPIVEELKAKARTLGLWNLFLPDDEDGAGLTVTDYAPIAELTGRVLWFAPEVFNCAAPDTGNMEILHMFGTPEQKEQWLQPLLAGEIRSAFSMTEPDVASSDAMNIRSSIRRDGNEYVISGRKWFSSGFSSDRCKFTIFMGVTNPDADPYHRQSMVIVPKDTQGVEIERDIDVFGYHDRSGHPEVAFHDVRVPVENLLGTEGSGFAIAQARLGPGRIHHCMRAIGMAERAFDMMCERSLARTAFGKPVADHDTVREVIAEARMRIEQARLLTLKTAWLIDTQTVKGARIEISAIKVVVPRMAQWVLDQAIQLFGAAGFTSDFPLARMYAQIRTLRMADGPDAVHIRTLARREIRRYEPGHAPEMWNG